MDLIFIADISDKVWVRKQVYFKMICKDTHNQNKNSSMKKVILYFCSKCQCAIKY